MDPTTTAREAHQHAQTATAAAQQERYRLNVENDRQALRTVVRERPWWDRQVKR